MRAEYKHIKNSLFKEHWQGLFPIGLILNLVGITYGFLFLGMFILGLDIQFLYLFFL